MKTIWKARKQQYVIRYFQLMLSRPMGLIKVVKKPAMGLKSWYQAMPRARWAKGHISTR